jgi:hypothetical protein
MHCLDHHSRYLVLEEHAGFRRFFLSMSIEPFNAFLTLTQMKGSHTAQAIVAEYEHVIKSWKLPISKVNFFSLYRLKSNIFSVD